MNTSVDVGDDEIRITIQVGNLSDFENLRYIADEHVKISGKIDDLIEENECVLQPDYLSFIIEVEVGDTIYFENTIFKELVKYPELHPTILEFINNIELWIEEYFIHIWVIDEFELGQFAAFYMAQENKKYINKYIDVLTRCDMDSEVFQLEQINALVDKHGIVQETIKLLACRIACSIGQHGIEQMEGYKDMLSAHFLENLKDLHYFLNTATKLLYEKGPQRESNRLSFSIIENIASVITDQKLKEDWLSSEEAVVRKLFEVVEKG